MTTQEEVQKRLSAAGTTPNKLRGQHFLVDKSMLEKVANAADITVGERVLEIGPGVGNLTDALLSKGAVVTAIERDTALAAFLARHYGDSVEVHSQDILSFDTTPLPAQYKVVGNVPYYITGKIIRKFMESSHLPQRVVFTVQKEVGERTAARPPHATFLSVLTQLMADVSLGPVIPADSFWPAPRVDSIILVIVPHGTQPDPSLVLLVRQGFHQPRKTLINNLAQLPAYERDTVLGALRQMDRDEKTRAHELSLDEWQKLFLSLKTG